VSIPEAEASALASSQHLTLDAEPWDFFALNSKYLDAKHGRQSQFTQLYTFLHVTSRMESFLETVLKDNRYTYSTITYREQEDKLTGVKEVTCSSH